MGKLTAALAMASLLTSGVASAVLCTTPAGTIADLSTVDAQATVNGALLFQIDPSSTGTGVISSFVRVQDTGCEQGYNTDGSPLQYDEKSGNFTHDLLLSDVPIVSISGINYRQFLLDVNQTNESLISLESIEIWQSNSGSLLNFTPGTGFATVGDDTLRWSLDGAGNRYVLLDYKLNSGSGSGDMFLYVPDNLFDSNLSNVYLFSRFGDHNNSNDGFEEWAVLKGSSGDQNVPEPATLALLATGLTLSALRSRRKMQHRS